MKGNRIKLVNEQTPQFELIDLESGYQLRYDFVEVSGTPETSASFNFNYVNIPDKVRESIIHAVIRDKYSQDAVEAITNNYLSSNNTLEYLKLLNYREYAKAIADQDNTTMLAVKAATCYQVELPFYQTLSGGAYEDLSNRMLKVKMNFHVDLASNKAIAYPAWISNEDMQVLQEDPRVLIKQIGLYAQV